MIATRTTPGLLVPLLALGTLALGGPAAGAAPSDRLVVEAGRILTLAGPDIEDGVIVIEDGRITAIGKRGEVEAPWDAPVMGGPDYVAFPGFVEAITSRGIDRSNESIDVAPFLSLRDSVDPVNFYFEDCLRWGITTVNIQHANNCVVGARGMIVRPAGMTVAEMAVKPVHGMKIAAGPKSGKSSATQAQALRLTFADLRRYLEELVQEKKDGLGHARREALYQGRELEGEKAKGRAMSGEAWKVDGFELVPRGEVDEKQEPLLELVEGRYDVYMSCGTPQQVHLGLEIARDNGFLHRTALVVSPSCWKVADVIAEAGVPVILTDLTATERDPITGEEQETFVPGVFRDKGVKFALTSQDPDSNSLWYRAAMATGMGLERADAVAQPEDLGRDGGDRVGSLEVGKDGNVVLFSGDPLSVTSWVEHVFIEGAHVYDRSEDTRNKHLLEAIEPRGTEPAAPEQPEDGSDDSEAGDDDDDGEDEDGDGDDGDEEDGE